MQTAPKGSSLIWVHTVCNIGLKTNTVLISKVHDFLTFICWKMEATNLSSCFTNYTWHMWQFPLIKLLETMKLVPYPCYSSEGPSNLYQTQAFKWALLFPTFLICSYFLYFFMKMPSYPYFFTLKCHLRIKIQNFFPRSLWFYKLTMFVQGTCC